MSSVTFYHGGSTDGQANAAARYGIRVFGLEWQVEADQLVVALNELECLGS